MTSKTQRRLQRAVDERWLVRIERSIPDAEMLYGFVLETTKRWTLLAIENGTRLNGFVAVRTRDVRKVKRRPRSLIRRHLDAHGQWPAPPPPSNIALGSLADLLDDITAQGRMVAIHEERTDPDMCFIGRVVGHRNRSFGLQEVTPKARWRTNATKWRYRDVTRVDFAGAYNTALEEVAGPPPEWGD